MKKLIMLIFISMMSLNVFSQSVIDSTLIRLKKPVARLVIKDLIAGDSYKEELSIVSDKVALLENKIVLKDSIENILLYKIDNLNLIISNTNTQLSLTNNLNEKLTSDLKKQKIKTKLIGGIGIITVIGTAILIK